MDPRSRTFAILMAVMLSAGMLCQFAGCATGGGGGVAPAVSPAMVKAAGGVPAAQLEAGRRVFAGPCTSCHRADPIESFSVSQWEAVVDSMSERTKLDPARRNALLAYLRAARTNAAGSGAN